MFFVPVESHQGSLLSWGCWVVRQAWASWTIARDRAWEGEGCGSSVKRSVVSLEGGRAWRMLGSLPGGEVQRGHSPSLPSLCLHHFDPPSLVRQRTVQSWGALDESELDIPYRAPFFKVFF